MIRKVGFFVATVVLFSQVISAEPQVLKLVRDKYTGTATIDATFDLNIYWSVREREEKRSGRLYLSPKNQFRVDLGNEVLVSDGKTYWQYSQRTSQVIIKNLSDIDLAWHPSQMLSTFLTKYEYTEKEKNGTQCILFWKADSAEDALYSEITVVVDSKNGVIQQLILTDKSDNVNTYTFKKTVFDRKFPTEVFKFEAPKDVQVLDTRE